jgi:hypothetical protein
MKWCECLKRAVENCDCPAAPPAPVGELVERLRWRGEHTSDHGATTPTLCREAADAITSLSERLTDQRYGGIDEGFRCAISALSFISLDREKNGTADEFRLVEKCIKAIVDARVRVRAEAKRRPQ